MAIEFNDDLAAAYAPARRTKVPARKLPPIIGLVMRMGLAKTERQASRILLVISVIFAFFAGYFTYKAMYGSHYEGPTDEHINEILRSTGVQIPIETR